MILVSLVLSGMAYAQYSTFIVDDDGNPLTTYPNLAAAIATAQTFAGGPHKIEIMAGNYSDHSLTVYDPTKIDEIYGDPAAAAGDIVFTQPAGPAKNFLTGWNGLVTLKHFALVGYGLTAINANGAPGLEITDMSIRGASGTGIDLSGTIGAVVDGIAFTKLTNGVVGTTVVGADVKNCTFDSCVVAADVTNFDGGFFQLLTVANGTWGLVLRAGSAGNEIKNVLIDGMLQEGITLQGADGNYVHDNEVRNCVSYAVSLDAASGVIGPNWVKFSCFVNNRAVGTSQGFDNAGGQNWWDGNYFSDLNFVMDGAAGEVDANPKLYTLTATAGAASYNFDDVFTVDFNWDMPACASLDSVKMAAYGFTVTYDATKLQYVPMAAYDEGLLGAAPEALYTAIDDGTPGQLTFAAANFTTPGVNGGRLAYAQFKVIGANTGTSFGFSGVDFRDPANDPMNYYVGSLSLTLVDNVAPVLVSYTQNNPAGDDTYSDGSVAGPGPFMKLMTTISATDNYALAMVEFSYDGAAFGNWYGISGTAYTDPTPQYAGGVAGLTEAPHTLALRVRDAAGLVSNVITYAFTIDRTGPVITSVTLKDADNCAVNVNYTNAVGILADFVDDGTAALMELQQNPNPFTDIGIAYANPANFTLAGTDGSKQVNVQLWDKYNNRGATAFDLITLDRVAPVPTAWLLAGGAAKTNVVGINGTYGSLGSGAAQLAYSENVGDLVCGSTAWQATGSPVAVTLSAGDGLKTVYFATRDNAGNISTPLSDQITLDQSAPVLTAYNVVDRTTLEDDCTKDGQIRAYYSFTGTDAVSLQWSYDGSTWGNWEVPSPSPDSADGSVTFALGYQKLYVRLVDDIGNIGNSMLDSIYVDGIAPTLSGVAAADIAATATPDPIYPGGVTNSTTFDLNLSGLSADVVGLKISQDNGATYSDVAVVTGGAATFTYTYTWTGTPTGCTWYPVWVKTVDCAGNESAPVSGNVYFDLPAPSITSFTGPAVTNIPLVSLTIVANDNCGLYLMRLGEGSLNGVPWVAFNANPSFTLSSGDGNKIVNLEVADFGGNIAISSVTIKLDQTVPTAGTFVIVSANPLAAPGYTDNLAGNIANITWDADVVQMYVRNSNGTGSTGWIPVASPHALAALAGVPALGVQTVQYRFRDGANNVGPASGWYTATIDYSNVAPPPPAPGSAFGIPVASCDLTWGKVAVGQSYLIRFNFQNQYPVYADPVPPHPANFDEGILAESGIVDTTYEFEGDHADIYSFSIWTLGNNGMWSASPNVDVVATNYILGDFSPTPDGCIKFTAEFGALAVAYNSNFGDPNFNDSLDIGPTNNTKSWGYPTTDQKIDFEDLVIFALNYDGYHCTTPTSEQPDNSRDARSLSASAIAVQVLVPSRVSAGDEFTIPVKVDNYQAVKGYHVVLDYNSDNFELVKVEAGEAYKSVAESFFYYDQKASNIDVSGVVLGSGVTFGADEFFKVTLRARSTSDVNLDEVQLTFRDRENSNIPASLGVVKTVTLPTAFGLSQNYPNPFNPTTNIELSLPVASNYKLTIYNVLGQAVQSFEGHSEAGYKTITWNASALASGIYLYRVEAGSYTATRKMVLLK